MRYHFTPLKTATIGRKGRTEGGRKTKIASVGKIGENGTLVHCWWESKMAKPR